MLLNNDKAVERFSCGIHYYVDPTTPSDIYLEEETINLLTKNGYKLAVSGLSSYLKTITPSFSPIMLSWEMTSRCNLECAFCYIRDNSISNEIRFSECKEVLNSLISEGLFEAYLSGGECLLLEDFTEIYTFLKEKGVFLTVFTNGFLINDELLQCWKELPPSSVEITLYNNDFSSKPFTNILKLREMGLHVVVKFTLSQNTLEIFDDVKKWALKNGVELMVDAELFDGNDEQHQNIEAHYSISIEQKKALNPSRYENIVTEKTIRTGLSCKSRKGTVHIAPDFTMAICNKMKTRWNLKEVDVRIAVDELRQLIGKYEHATLHGCEGCNYSKMCEMCFASAIKKNGKLYVRDGYCSKIKEKYIRF